MQGNIDNQNEVDSLKPLGMASNEFLNDFNLKADLVENSSKVKLTRSHE